MIDYTVGRSVGVSDKMPLCAARYALRRLRENGRFCVKIRVSSRSAVVCEGTLSSQLRSFLVLDSGYIAHSHSGQDTVHRPTYDLQSI